MIVGTYELKDMPRGLRFACIGSMFLFGFAFGLLAAL